MVHCQYFSTDPQHNNTHFANRVQFEALSVFLSGSWLLGWDWHGKLHQIVLRENYSDSDD